MLDFDLLQRQLYTGVICDVLDSLDYRNQAMEADVRPVLDAIDLPYQVIDEPGDIGLISRGYRHSRTFCRPFAVLFTRDLLRGAQGDVGHRGH